MLYASSPSVITLPASHMVYFTIWQLDERHTRGRREASDTGHEGLPVGQYERSRLKEREQQEYREKLEQVSKGGDDELQLMMIMTVMTNDEGGDWLDVIRCYLYMLRKQSDPSSLKIMFSQEQLDVGTIFFFLNSHLKFFHVWLRQHTQHGTERCLMSF